MSQGKIVQCIGAVVDVEFERNSMPRVYDALKLEGTRAGTDFYPPSKQTGVRHTTDRF